MRQSKARVVRQVLVGAAGHDAITNIALELADHLNVLASCQIHSWFEPDESVAGRISQIARADIGTSDDVIVYHLSYGVPELTSWLMNRPERIVVWYHNVTPATYFWEFDREFAEGLEHGRREIGLLRDITSMAVADSDFNAKELVEAGYEEVVVTPPRMSVGRLDEVGADAAILSRIWDVFPNGFLLVVSQLLPHKRANHAVSVVHLLREYLGLDIGLVWAGPARLSRYRNAVDMFQRMLNEPGVLFLDVVSDAELAALYRGCICFVSFSEHEGLSLPPLEAMANRAPVVVRGSGAVPETVGQGAVVVPESAGLMEFAGILYHVIQDPILRSDLRRRGLAHLKTVGLSSRFADVASQIVGRV